MLFITHYSVRPGMRDATIARFAQTGGQPPQGVKLLGRWHGVGSPTGFLVTEADDAAAMARFSLEWNDLMDLEVQPALNDEQLAAVLASMKAGS